MESRAAKLRVEGCAFDQTHSIAADWDVERCPDWILNVRTPIRALRSYRDVRLAVGLTAIPLRANRRDSAERLALRRVRLCRIINPMLENETLQRLTSLIVSIGAPRRVYLFGSQALGFASKESDMDVLVVVPDDIADTRALAAAIRVAISELVAIPCDVLVERESVFLERSELPTIERTILETGISLYAA